MYLHGHAYLINPPAPPHPHSKGKEDTNRMVRLVLSLASASAVHLLAPADHLDSTDHSAYTRGAGWAGVKWWRTWLEGVRAS